VLYDSREGNLRDNQALTDTTLSIGGAMYYVELDVGNLNRWLTGAIGASGVNVVNQNGYIVYFSDRRNNRNTNIVVPSVRNRRVRIRGRGEPRRRQRIPNGPAGVVVIGGVPEKGEDFNGNTILDVYGKIPPPANLPAGNATPLDGAARPWNTANVTPGGADGQPSDLLPPRAEAGERRHRGRCRQDSRAWTDARHGKPHLRAGRLQRDRRRHRPERAEPPGVRHPCRLPHRAVEQLEGRPVVLQPNDPAGRPTTTTSYRMAVVAGKGLSFPLPTAWAADTLFGTDGGVGNFLRYVENWATAGTTIYYKGSIISLYISRQATGTISAARTSTHGALACTTSTPTSSCRRCCRLARRCSATSTH